jgi:hypothetical protein
VFNKGYITKSILMWNDNDKKKIALDPNNLPIIGSRIWTESKIQCLLGAPDFLKTHNTTRRSGMILLYCIDRVKEATKNPYLFQVTKVTDKNRIIFNKESYYRKYIDMDLTLSSLFSGFNKVNVNAFAETINMSKFVNVDDLFKNEFLILPGLLCCNRIDLTPGQINRMFNLYKDRPGIIPSLIRNQKNLTLKFLTDNFELYRESDIEQNKVMNRNVKKRILLMKSIMS